MQPTTLIGRERELREIVGLLRREEVRLLSLTGTGGTGKTRLALEAGAELLKDFRSGVFFVSLAPIRDSGLVLPTIAQALSLREVPGEELPDTLAAYLEQKQMLLVLDNFEQVIDAAIDVAVLLRRCPKLKLVVTSRERAAAKAKAEDEKLKARAALNAPLGYGGLAVPQFPLTVQDIVSGERSDIPVDAMFVLIGSQPHTDWLGTDVARDQWGFLLTGPDLPAASTHCETLNVALIGWLRR